MNDLFDSIAEAKAEREAIMIESGVPNAVEAAADDLHRCEVHSVINRFFPDADAAAGYLSLVEQKRGKPAADLLRADCRKAWVEKRNDIAGRGSR